MGMIDDDPVDQLGNRLDQRRFGFILDDQPPRRGAALPGGEVGRLDRDHRRRVNVRRLPHHQRIIPAQLEREHLVRCLGELAVERHSGARRPGEQQTVDPGLTSQRLALLGSADQHSNNALGDPRSAQAVDQKRARRRGLF